VSDPSGAAGAPETDPETSEILPTSETASPEAESDDDLIWDEEPVGSRAEVVLAYLADQLVDDHEAVIIESEPGRNGGTRLSLRVASDDMGKVIGRRGRVAQSIRSVVRAAGAAEGHDVVVDIVD
jgi:predicted RNA-binding protein YlqC (UPF0109 family)